MKKIPLSLEQAKEVVDSLFKDDSSPEKVEGFIDLITTIMEPDGDPRKYAIARQAVRAAVFYSDKFEAVVDEVMDVMKPDGGEKVH